MQNFWNQRFSEPEFVYGREPNAFFKEMLEGLTPGKLLLPAEGQGRNAVYAAQKGWAVTAFDNAEVGRERALAWAAENEVSIEYLHVGYEDSAFDGEQFDAIALIYAHMPAALRTAFHQKLQAWLKPGGHLIVECFSPHQLNYPSGGPKQAEMLVHAHELREDFNCFNFLSLVEGEIELKEGAYHQGAAHVVRCLARKP
ncbi:SAM-dependent methyltransferase [bacterium (Candidatus Blackallbacteria) CG17_big_fil_post_rev_8_21_14_2_50_48_46]|uniref:SAM-dependent methyltransferase n=1 Tax=bacterium (Candidatus Blackallbacteria) CG17_big_fil_post_rev_8_21_14_2_50_48_46 TaxID=2014261 RepID=A0A2M7G9A4_9BACT|nr:MAG: SAM-dependent methyltransferase [bacterium (Candidatus Blackallbacteria) CG18_big_fil_WC_8_21_14_2_50_49_26]PIW18434.1 MAG: SAM-dependent methyltransferase [bacterium (Candidatus Blackallbacteria) CG17_big_fil_post_rev_8_21_14_2_50_48_46]PIW46581.1 MAG: SAM-dependent methyltransferase [bacterium (Candidatus Blackallbacteria) CG13_big_fil_rev_8_21_14_2_50_49_14]